MLTNTWITDCSDSRIQQSECSIGLVTCMSSLCIGCGVTWEILIEMNYVLRLMLFGSYRAQIWRSTHSGSYVHASSWILHSFCAHSLIRGSICRYTSCRVIEIIKDKWLTFCEIIWENVLLRDGNQDLSVAIFYSEYMSVVSTKVMLWTHRS